MPIQDGWRALGRWAGAATVAGAILAAAGPPGPALAQTGGGAERNWMADYVQARVLRQTVRSIAASPGRSTPADLEALARPRIVGGTAAGAADNPFQVALLLRAEPDNLRAQFCGGTLVRPDTVVTAAHCSDFARPDQVQVLAGTRRLDGSGARLDVARIVLHPGWNPDNFDNDVAVWRLSSPAAASVPTASLATEDGPVGGNLLATGWGALAEGGASPVALQRVEVPLVSRANCSDANSYGGRVTDRMICAGFDAGGRDTCQGDSGGPLTRGPGNGVLTGVTSWGDGCARPNLFGVYARVSEPGIRRFIEANLGAPAGGAAAEATGLFQMHDSGGIWRFTGEPCAGAACPGWQLLDNNPQTRAVAASAAALYQIHGSGAIWRHTGVPCGPAGCPGWQLLDNNPRSRQIEASGADLYQLHDGGAIWRFTGAPCVGGSCPGWQLLDNNPRTVAVSAGTGGLYQLHNTGAIWRHTGAACDASGCPGWQLLDNNPRTVAILANGSDLYQLHSTGAVWRHTGAPCSGGSCPGWQMLDNNPRTVAIAAAAGGLYQLHNSGAVWRHTGVPCGPSGCPGWQMLDSNPNTRAIAAGGAELFQIHGTGAIFRHTGTPCGPSGCPGWQLVDNNPRGRAIVASGD